MFYSDMILSKRGPLARVWIAAHLEKKLSKKEAINTDIAQSVEVILNPSAVEPMALRMSGQLLLGVTRIYSRKARYLLEDCTDALTKLRTAFRPGQGVVDMAEDQLVARKDAITLQEDTMWDDDGGLGFGGWDVDVRIYPSTRNTVAARDITLPSSDFDAFGTFAYNDPLLGSHGLDFDASFSGGIGTQDFDLNLDFGDMSVEHGRRDSSVARSARESILGSEFGGAGKEREGSVEQGRRRESVEPFGMEEKRRASVAAAADDWPQDEGGMKMDWDDQGAFDGGIDLGFNFDDANPFDDGPPALERDKTPQPGDERRSRSPSNPPTPTDSAALTPRTRQAIEEKNKTPTVKTAPSRKRQILDAQIELQGRAPGQPGASQGSQSLRQPGRAEVALTLGSERYLPRSRALLAHLSIVADPLAHFLPSSTDDKGNQTLNAAPPSLLAPELAALFVVPSTCLRRPRSPAGDSPSKRARIEQEGEEEEEDVEAARRVKRELSFGGVGAGTADDWDVSGAMGWDDYVMGDVQLDEGAACLVPGDDGLDVDWGDVPAPAPAPPSRAGAEPASRFSTPAPLPDDSACPIAVFDRKAGATAGEDAGSESQTAAADGFSRNTLRAREVVRRQLGEDAEGKVSFKEVSKGATRRAASSFFFELLVLGTRDVVALKQDAPYADIEVRPKDKLWVPGASQVAVA